jgi:hypothetical protein
VNFLLMRQELKLACIEGILGESKKRADHSCCSFRRRSPLATASSSRALPMRCPLK